MSAFDAARAAGLLAAARLSGVRLSGFPPELTPVSLKDGYAIQECVARLRAVPVAAFKVGLTTPEAQRANGASEPIVGRLARADLRFAPAQIALKKPHLGIVETEVIFEIGRELYASNAPFSRADIAQSVARAYAGIELCDSRFSNGDDLSLAHLVADNSNADLLIMGEVLPNLAEGVLTDLPVSLLRNDCPPIAGSTSKVLQHPLNSVLWLANWLAERGENLTSGQLIATGSCTGMVEVTPNSLVSASFGTLAQVSAQFVQDIQ